MCMLGSVEKEMKNMFMPRMFFTQAACMTVSSVFVCVCVSRAVGETGPIYTLTRRFPVRCL